MSFHQQSRFQFSASIALMFLLSMSFCEAFAQFLPDSLNVGKREGGQQRLGRQRKASATLQQPPHFEVIKDRWQGIKTPPYELNVEGNWYDPYNQNLLKGDYPILGQNTFLIVTAVTDNFVEASRLPTPSGVSTALTQNERFFGFGERVNATENLRLTFELYHGAAAYKPRDWEIKVTPVFSINYLTLRQNNEVNISPRFGFNRTDRQLAFQELSLEKHLFNLSDRFDFVSLRAGIQRFASDFRSFVFNDFNLASRLFGSAHSNRFQYNLAYFYMLEKDTNSQLNTVFQDRQQQVYIANLYRQDLFALGYTGQISLHYNRDRASTYFNTNGVPTRPSLLGVVLPHEVRAFYLGWTGDGHFGRLNVSNALYQVFGSDSYNQLARRPTYINAQMGALELSYDQDWKRYKISMFYASGDPRPFDRAAQGFDTIIDQPVFAGGPFSFWNLQGIRLLGVNLVNRLSLVPNLRPSKTEGQPNFVNPGLWLFNAAFEAEVTPKVKAILNLNYLRFANTATIQQFINQNAIDNNIGLDYGLGVIYRPFLNNNAIFTFSATALTPFKGFSDIYESKQTLFAFFSSLVLTY